MKPIVAGPWRRIIEYPENHLNDFCLFRGPDGRWHAMGIMGTGTWASETSLFHSSSADLYGPYERHEPLLREMPQGDTRNAAPQKHAPFVIVKDGVCHMFLRRPPGTTLLLRTDDPFRWPGPPAVLFEERDARDACVQLFGGVYHLYYCQWLDVEGKGRSCILLRRSRDLLHWDAPVAVHVDTSRESRHSHLESPFVIPAAGAYWLFVRDRSLDARCVTTVFRSDTPDRFASGTRAWDAEIEGVHAPELVEHAGAWHLARVSGPPDHLPGAPKQGGWVDIAPISFA